MIHLLRTKATAEQAAEMLKEYESMIKIVVDIRRRVLSGGGEMHSDCESVLFHFGFNTPPLAAEERVWGLPRG